MEKKSNDSKFVLLRKSKGVTQKQIADALGVTERTVWAWEKGHQIPNLSIPQIKALCRVLDTTVEDLPDNFGPATEI
ncbi:MAG: helix-turn-helix transcriptional regulator [Cyanobacteria bacterium J06626_18]